MNLFCPIPPWVVCLGVDYALKSCPSDIFVWSIVIKHILSQMRSITPNPCPSGGLVFILHSRTFCFLSLIFHEHISVGFFVCLFVLFIHDYVGPLLGQGILLLNFLNFFLSSPTSCLFLSIVWDNFGHSWSESLLNNSFLQSFQKSFALPSERSPLMFMYSLIYGPCKF